MYVTQVPLVFGQSGLKTSGVICTFADLTIPFSSISHSLQDQTAAVMALNCIADERPPAYSKPVGKT